MIQRINTFEETEYFWLIPSAIDLPTILSKHPPAFKGYKIHYFYHIIDTICDRMEFIDFNDETQWVHLSSKILEDFNPKYKLYLHYLIQVGILDYNPSYEVGERCKGFRISPTYYDGTPVYVLLTNKDFIIWKKAKALKQPQNKKKKAVMEQGIKEEDEYAHLTKWFNDNLQIDVEGAYEEIEHIFPRYGGREDFGVKGEILRKKTDGKFKALRAVERLSSCDFYYKLDNNIVRFHSNLTGLKKELRNYITYDGKKLVNLDITNSQPLLSGVLLNPDFYQRGENFNIYSINSLNTLLNTKISHFHKSIRHLPYSIMFLESEQSLVQLEFQKYLNFIQSGEFYEMLSQLIYPEKAFDRKKVKETTYIIFFCDNRHGLKERRLEQPFIKEFPHVHALFSMLKKHNKLVLSHILQRIESHIVIEKSTRRIAQERPNLPIYTIHDSITTTVGNEKYVKSVLIEEIKAITGLNANIATEYWDKNLNAQNELKTEMKDAV